jgi:hypothetical protein
MIIESFTVKNFNIYIIMWSCPRNMPKYYPGLRDILPDRRSQNITQVWETYYPTEGAKILPRSERHITRPKEPKYYPGLRDILPDRRSQNITHVWETYYECLITQVICQNITVPNINTETYTKYDNVLYPIGLWVTSF